MVLVACEHVRQVIYIADGQAERFDLGQFGITRHVRNMSTKFAEGLVDRLCAAALLFVSLDSLDNPFRWRARSDQALIKLVLQGRRWIDEGAVRVGQRFACCEPIRLFPIMLASLKVIERLRLKLVVARPDLLMGVNLAGCLIIQLKVSCAALLKSEVVIHRDWAVLVASLVTFSLTVHPGELSSGHKAD